MRIEDDQLTMDYLEAAKAAESRMRRTFLASTGVSLLVLLDFAFVILQSASVPRLILVSFPALLLWSFMVTSYSFHCMLRMAIDRRHLLEDRAVTDPQTGVRSLAYIRSLIQKEYDKALRTGQSTAILYVDLVNMELVNQKFGHAVGDIVLAGVAKAIQKSLPEHGVVGRVGGDEFTVVLPATAPQKAKSVVADIERAVKGHKLEMGKRGRVDFVNCRIGCISCPAEGGFADEIIGIAQQAAVASREEALRGAITSIRESSIRESSIREKGIG